MTRKIYKPCRHCGGPRKRQPWGQIICQPCEAVRQHQAYLARRQADPDWKAKNSRRAKAWRAKNQARIRKYNRERRPELAASL